MKVRPEALLIVKPAALPELLLAMARRAPDESLTTLAVTPRFCPLMEAANWSSVSTLPPIGICVAVPDPTVRVKLPDARGALLLATESEYQDAVVAMLLTTMT